MLLFRILLKYNLHTEIGKKISFSELLFLRIVLFVVHNPHEKRNEGSFSKLMSLLSLDLLPHLQFYHRQAQRRFQVLL